MKKYSFRTGIMRKISQGKWMRSAAIALTLCVAGCNLFHPTGSRDAESDDSAALTRDGYLEFQKSNYDSARKFFNKAIRADSGNSEAWIGLSKSVLKTQDGLNVFELASLAQKTEKDGKSSNGFLDMSDAKADSISRGIDSVLFYLDKFIARDTTDRTDKKVRFSTIADSYTILQLTKAALRIRNIHTQLTNVVSADNAGMMVNLNTLNDLGDSLKPFLNDMAAAAEAIKASPESAAEIIKAYLPDSTRDAFNDEDYADISVGLANTVIELNDRAQTVGEDRNDVFFKFGNHIDDDGDGCVDEEVVDNYDNDGDGEVDEDARDYRTVVLVKRPQNYAELVAQGMDPKTYDLTKAQVDTLKFIGSYQSVDINMDGTFGPADRFLPEEYWQPLDESEWHYVYRDPNMRDSLDNHLLKFAIDLSFPGKDLDEKIKNKELIRNDTNVNNIKYNLQKRKEMVGGCWKYYTEEQFLQWFEGRIVK
ncbi:tetratricopeptide repeat protein [Fibrobacter sp. UWB12]|uniref:tetratricopeptide repeat protein n=1 Tax=Fibrobacter sp. UWB12 TaxID=1896203 RepID=UPI0020C8F4BC|nr:hypothetical protein [Fibrobacter sp. UWB12]